MCVCVRAFTCVCACSHVPAAHPVVLCVLQVCVCAHLFQQCVLHVHVCVCECECGCVWVHVCVHSPVPAAHPAAFSARWPPSCGWQRHQEAPGVGRPATGGGGLGAARKAGADPGPGGAAGVWSWAVVEVAVLPLPGRLEWRLGVKPSHGDRHPHAPPFCVPFLMSFFFF